MLPTRNQNLKSLAVAFAEIFQGGNRLYDTIQDAILMCAQSRHDSA